MSHEVKADFINVVKVIEVRARDWWSYKNYNSERAENELKKCILVCKNCHMELHWGVSNS